MEREGKTEGKKIEEEERQHTVRPSEEKKMKEEAGTDYVKQEKEALREEY